MTYKSKGEATGRLFEEERLYPAGDERVKAIRKIAFDSIAYKPFREAIQQCLHNPNGYKESNAETYDPPAGWMRQLHFLLTQKLGLRNWENLKVYPALGTAADKFHGVDFLLRFTDPDTLKTYDVTVDLTVNKSKASGYKADVIITDTGAFASDAYPFVGAIDIPEIDHASKAEDDMIHTQRLEAAATIITGVLGEQMKNASVTRRDTAHKNRPAIRVNRKRQTA